MNRIAKIGYDYFLVIKMIPMNVFYGILLVHQVHLQHFLNVLMVAILFVNLNQFEQKFRVFQIQASHQSNQQP
jgi:hypothetical protein